jgi:predicted dehydrogenase
MSEKVLLVGAGRMGLEYGRVIKAMNIGFTVVGRGDASASVFTEKTGLIVETGGIEKWIEGGGEIPDKVIIAVKVVDLYRVCSLVIDAGAKAILLEKPGALYLDDILQLVQNAKRRNTDVFVAYNRRFCESVIKASEILKNDGGVLSFQFEFTEWSDKVAAFETDAEEKAMWFLSNSSHVADLAFYLGGIPSEMNSYTEGSINWHKGAAVFSGSGRSVSGALFSYSSNWNAPGRWGVELLSENHRIILRPLEQLYVQKKGTLVAEKTELRASHDNDFKPGLYRMVSAFVGERKEGLCRLEEQAEVFRFYNQIAGYR